MFPILPRQDQYLQGQQCSSGYVAICRGEQIEWILSLSTLTPFPRCGPNTLTLALGVPAQHLILVSKLDHLQDFSAPDTQVLATPTPGLGIGVNHHLCLNHNLAFKLGEHHVKMLDFLYLLLPWFLPQDGNQGPWVPVIPGLILHSMFSP